MVLKGVIINDKAVAIGDLAIRMPLRPIYCIECGRQKEPVLYCYADEGYIPEGDINEVLRNCLCVDCAQLYAEKPEEGFQPSSKTKSKDEIEKLLKKIFEWHEVDTIEELNELLEDKVEPIVLTVANAMVGIWELLDDM